MWDSALHYFYEAANLGSMRLASDKIGVAVSSISRQIAQLEYELGIPLIERGRRSIRLTEAGQLAYEYHKNQLAGREGLLNQIQELREVKTGRIDLAIGEGFFGPPFTAMIEAFQARNPGIAISVSCYTSSEIVRMVVDDEAHIGMILHTTSEPKIRTRTVLEQPLMVLCAPEHPAAAMDVLSIADLARFQLCLPPPTFRIRAALIEAQKRAQVCLEARLVTTSIQMMREIAKGGRAVTVLPRISAIAELEEGSLVARPLIDDTIEHTTVSLIHRLGRQLDGAPARLLGVIEAKLKSWS
jgi:DNA-binding transcriptional LysR family regulator